LTQLGLAQSAAGWRERLTQLEAAGATEICYQPAGQALPAVALVGTPSHFLGAGDHYDAMAGPGTATAAKRW